MENMVISLNAVLPLFLIIALGCAAKQLHILSDDAARQANGLCFKLFMAPSCSTMSIPQTWPPPTVGNCWSSVSLVPWQNLPLASCSFRT